MILDIESVRLSNAVDSVLNALKNNPAFRRDWQNKLQTALGDALLDSPLNYHIGKIIEQGVDRFLDRLTERKGL